MPMDRTKYPPDWNAISERIRFQRAGGKCEACGVPHGAMIVRSTVDPARYLLVDETFVHCTPDGRAIRLSEIPEEFADGSYVRVVLTTAHLDHDPSNNDEANLKALCQRCHLKHDGAHHARNAARTRARKRYTAQVDGGQQCLDWTAE